jgi:hypothetical protein
MKFRIAVALIALAISAATVAPVAAQTDNPDDPRENATRPSGGRAARNRERAPRLTPEQITAAAQERPPKRPRSMKSRARPAPAT